MNKLTRLISLLLIPCLTLSNVEGFAVAPAGSPRRLATKYQEQAVTAPSIWERNFTGGPWHLRHEASLLARATGYWWGNLSFDLRNGRAKLMQGEFDQYASLLRQYGLNLDAVKTARQKVAAKLARKLADDIDDRVTPSEETLLYVMDRLREDVAYGVDLKRRGKSSEIAAHAVSLRIVQRMLRDHPKIKGMARFWMEAELLGWHSPYWGEICDFLDQVDLTKDIPSQIDAYFNPKRSEIKAVITERHSKHNIDIPLGRSKDPYMIAGSDTPTPTKLHELRVSITKMSSGSQKMQGYLERGYKDKFLDAVLLWVDSWETILYKFNRSEEVPLGVKPQLERAMQKLYLINKGSLSSEETLPIFGQLDRELGLLLEAIDSAEADLYSERTTDKIKNAPPAAKRANTFNPDAPTLASIALDISIRMEGRPVEDVNKLQQATAQAAHEPERPSDADVPGGLVHEAKRGVGIVQEFEDPSFESGQERSEVDVWFSEGVMRIRLRPSDITLTPRRIFIGPSKTVRRNATSKQKWLMLLREWQSEPPKRERKPLPQWLIHKLYLTKQDVGVRSKEKIKRVIHWMAYMHAQLKADSQHVPQQIRPLYVTLMRLTEGLKDADPARIGQQKINYFLNQFELHFGNLMSIVDQHFPPIQPKFSESTTPKHKANFGINGRTAGILLFVLGAGLAIIWPTLGVSLGLIGMTLIGKGNPQEVYSAAHRQRLYTRLHDQLLAHGFKLTLNKVSLDYTFHLIAEKPSETWEFKMQDRSFQFIHSNERSNVVFTAFFTHDHTIVVVNGQELLLYKGPNPLINVFWHPDRGPLFIVDEEFWDFVANHALLPQELRNILCAIFVKSDFLAAVQAMKAEMEPAARVSPPPQDVPLSDEAAVFRDFEHDLLMSWDSVDGKAFSNVPEKDDIDRKEMDRFDREGKIENYLGYLFRMHDLFKEKTGLENFRVWVIDDMPGCPDVLLPIYDQDSSLLVIPLRVIPGSDAQYPAAFDRLITEINKAIKKTKANHISTNVVSPPTGKNKPRAAGREYSVDSLKSFRSWATGLAYGPMIALTLATYYLTTDLHQAIIVGLVVLPFTLFFEWVGRLAQQGLSYLADTVTFPALYAYTYMGVTQWRWKIDGREIEKIDRSKISTFIRKLDRHTSSSRVSDEVILKFRLKGLLRAILLEQLNARSPLPEFLLFIRAVLMAEWMWIFLLRPMTNWGRMSLLTDLMASTMERPGLSPSRGGGKGEDERNKSPVRQKAPEKQTPPPEKTAAERWEEAPEVRPPVTFDEQRKAFYPLTRARRWADLSQSELGLLKGFIVDARYNYPELAEEYLNDAVIAEALLTDLPMRDLVRRAHPRTLQSLKDLKEGKQSVDVQNSEDVYWWLYARCLRNDPPLEVVVNVDVYNRAQSTDPDGKAKLSGVNDTNWAPAAVEDGLIQEVLQVRLSEKAGYIAYIASVIKRDWGGVRAQNATFPDLKDYLKNKGERVVVVHLNTFSTHGGYGVDPARVSPQKIPRYLKALGKALMEPNQQPQAFITVISRQDLKLWDRYFKTYINDVLEFIQSALEKGDFKTWRAPSELQQAA